MTTFDVFSKVHPDIVPSTLWYISDLMEARGKQELYTKQSPQRLKTLREHALIESAVSSNRIEGVEVDRARVGTVVLSTLRAATREFTRRVESVSAPKGEKAELVRDAVMRQVGEFRASDIERECPGVGLDWIRKQLSRMKDAGDVERVSMGRNARWRVTGRQGLT
jgi:hypothetical protein